MESSGEQYLVFGVCHSLFAIATPTVLETFGLPEITSLESPQPSIIGVINVRGIIIPLMDLNIRFGRPPEKLRLSNGVVVVSGEGQPIGIIVDEVLDVITILPEDIGLPPFSASEGNSPSRFSLGVAKVGEDIITILDSAKLVSTEAALSPRGGVCPQKAMDGACVWGPSENRQPPPPEVPADEKAAFHVRAGDLRKKAHQDDLGDLEQVAVVTLGGEYFGIEVKAVQEFSPITNLTPIPNCPEHIIGNMNLRGHILTVIDIRGPLGMLPGKVTSSSKIMVTSVENLRVGIAIDDIFDIAFLRSTDLTPLPTSVRSVIEKHARGTARYAGKAMTILNIAEILKYPGLLVNQDNLK